MAKEKNEGDASIILQVGEALSTLRGIKGPPKKERITQRKPERSKAGMETGGTAKGGISLQEQTHIKAKPETKEWADEVIKELKKGKLPPEIVERHEVSVSHETIVKSKSQAEWLVGMGDMPQSEVVAQVVADIASSELSNDPNYLLAKGAQLRWAMKADTPQEVQKEARVYLQKIHQKVLEGYQKQYDMPLEKQEIDGQEVLVAKFVDGKDQFTPEQRDLWNVAGHNLTGYESGMPTMRTSRDYKWDPAAEPVKDKKPATKKTTTASTSPTTPTAESRHKSIKSILEEFNEHAEHLSPEALERVIYGTYNELIEHHRDEISQIPQFMDRLAERINDIAEQHRTRGEGWNSLYVTEEIQRGYFLNPFQEVRGTQDRFNRSTKLLGNAVQDAIEYERRNHIQFVQSKDFRTRRMEYIQNPQNWDEIDAIYGSREHIDRGTPDGYTKHFLYQQVENEAQYQAFRDELVDKLSTGDMLQKAYVSYQLGSELDKMGVAYAGLGEPGVMSVLNDRGGLNSDSFDVLDRLGEDILYGPNGEPINISGPVMESLLEEATDEMFSQKALYEPKFKKAYGDRAELSRDEIRASVEETFMLVSITGRRAQFIRRGLVHHEVQQGAGGFNPSRYAGETAESRVLQAQEPVRFLMLRWGTISPVQRMNIEKAARFEAKRLEIDTYWDKRIKNSRSPAAREKLVKDAFWVYDDDPATLKTALETYMSYDASGNHRKPPETAANLSDEDLHRWLVIRDGIRQVDQQMLAGYDYFGAGWNMAESLRVIDQHFSDAEIASGANLAIGLHERTKSELGDGLFSSTITHEKIGEKRQELIHEADPTKDPKDIKDGMLVVMAKFSPLHIIRALREHQSPVVERYLADHLGTPGFSIFKKLDGNGNPVSVPTSRHDQFFREYSKYHQLINKRLADFYVDDATLPKGDPRKFRGLDPIDWSSGVISPEQRAVIDEVCGTTGTNPDEFIKLSKELTEFTLKRETLEEVSHPAIAQYFLTVNKIEARLRRYDDGPKEWDADKKKYIGKWSSRIAHYGGHGGGTGLKRWAGDLQNSWSAVSKDLLPLLGAPNLRTFEQHFQSFIDTVVFTGGHGAKARTAQSLALAWGRNHQRDIGKDFFGMGGENSFKPSCDAQRAAGMGEQSITMQEFDHLIHFAEASAGVKFHDMFPHITHEAEKEARMLISIGWPKFIKNIAEKSNNEAFKNLTNKDILTFHTIWLYRYWVLGAIILFFIGEKAVSETQKGLSGDSSEGGGGGHGGH